MTGRGGFRRLGGEAIREALCQQNGMTQYYALYLFVHAGKRRHVHLADHSHATIVRVDDLKLLTGGAAAEHPQRQEKPFRRWRRRRTFARPRRVR